MLLHTSQLQRSASWPAAPAHVAVRSVAKPLRPMQSHSQHHVVLACAYEKPFASAARDLHVRTSRSRKPTVAVRANWGAPVEFKTAKVLQNKQSAPGLHQLLVDVGALAAGYTKAGQFIQAKVGAESKAGFFAIASPPDVNNSGVVELLVKKVPGGTAEALCNLAAGEELLVSPVQGKGFPVDKIPPSEYPTVLLFATGSGISPIKAVIESGALELPKRKEVKLFYGTRSADSAAYKDLIPTWSALGVKVVQVHSSKGGAIKYVQDALAAEGPLTNPKGTGVLMCGQKDMCTAVTAQLQPQGVEHLLLNF